ncbi:MAG: glycosyltransferase [Candidatus Gastranaerophilaceae bacterium]
MKIKKKIKKRNIYNKSSNIAILYICTGRYTIFWKEFYKSCERFFIKNSKKHYYVFTDNKEFKAHSNNITVLHQENLGWPMIACMRFKILNKLKEALNEYDYAFFFNANMEFLREVKAKEFLPDKNSDGIVAAQHSMNNREKNNIFFPYERNPKSCTCIPYGYGSKYYHSGIIGGRIDKFLQLLTTCERMMDEDLNHQITPKVHDESVFNKYILDKNFLELSNFYIYPTVGKFFYKFDKRIKIIQRDKSSYKYGGHAYLRGQSDKRNIVIKEEKQDLRNPKISILIITKDNLNKFRLTFNAVLAQYYQNYEIIIIDNSIGSIIKDFLSVIEIPKIRYFKNEHELSKAESIDKGIKLSCGNVVKLLDCNDELIGHDNLEKFIADLEKYER